MKTKAVDNLVATSAGIKAEFPNTVACKSCHYWAVFLTPGDGQNGVCGNPTFSSMSFAKASRAIEKNDLLFVSDDDVVVQTGENFGCKLWLERA